MRCPVSLSVGIVSALVASLLFGAGSAVAITPQDPLSTDLSLRSDGVAGIVPGGGLGLLQNDSGSGAAGDTTLDGPYFLRSADTQPTGTVDLKFVYTYVNRNDRGDRENHEGTFILEWGMMKNVELIFQIGSELGNGNVRGNGDIEQFGFQIKHWEEDGLRPAFATRHLMRIPTGYHSDGVDYTARGMLTWTLNDTVRLHFNPYLQTINGNRDEGNRYGFGRRSRTSFSRRGYGNDGDRWFRWGAAIGFECRPRENLVYILDYLVKSNDRFGESDQHSIEIGGEWEFSPGHSFGWGTEFEIDGDDAGDDFSFGVMYIMELEGPAFDG